MNDDKELKKFIDQYGSILEGHYSLEEDTSQAKTKISYEDTQARRDNMTNVGNLDYEI